MLDLDKKTEVKEEIAAPARYVLVTPTRNEEAHLERTIRGIAAQTVRPVRWVIVSDGSTDRTDEIAARHAEDLPFIRVARVEDQARRDFASKVHAFKTGYALLRDERYDFIGNLDADIYVEPGYYEAMLSEFQRDPGLGLAGGVRYDLCFGAFRRFAKAPNSVGGCVQLFRRSCFEAIGGFTPVKYGGEDAIAEIMTRKLGWEVRSFPSQKIYHYRETGIMGRSLLRTRFHEGIKDYLIGYHPLFEALRCLFRLNQKRPFLAGSALSMLGYAWAWLRQFERPVPEEVVRYLRSEQLQRLKKLL